MSEYCGVHEGPHLPGYSQGQLVYYCSVIILTGRRKATIMMTTEKIFSYLVLAATLPKPTVVREVQVKYKEVT